MLLVILLLTVFIVSFVLLSIWIRKSNRKDETEERMSVVLIMGVAGVFALLLTGVAAFFWFLFLGSTNVINTLFSLEISKKDLLLMSVVYLVFIFTLDNIFQVLVKLLTSQKYMFYFLMLWIRMVAFYLIGDFFSLTHYTNIVISGGVALIWSLLELLYEWKTKKDS